MPISAPMPNSAPSANCVEAFHRTIAESRRRQENRSATALFLGHDGFRMMRAIFFDMRDHLFHTIDDLHRDDRVEIFGGPVFLGRGRGCGKHSAYRFVAANFATGLREIAENILADAESTARSINRVSAEPHTETRRILAFSAMARALRRIRLFHGDRRDTRLPDARAPARAPPPSPGRSAPCRRAE